ncbi:MAG: hypothetical protein MJZ50_06475 [Treponema sp.]|nr:hypothetical protein [Treponema sp.]
MMNVLIFTGGKSAGTEKASLFFACGWKPDYIVCADSGLDSYERYRLAFPDVICRDPDFLVGDFDSISNENLLEKYSSCPRKIYSHDKDYTDTQLALMHARNEFGEDCSIAMVGGNGGRTDHFVFIFESYAGPFHPDIWLCEEEVLYFLGEGRTAALGGLSREDRISVARIPSCFYGQGPVFRGFDWEQSYGEGMASLSNRISSSWMEEGKSPEIQAVKGSFIVFVPYGGNISVKISSERKN